MDESSRTLIINARFNMSTMKMCNQFCNNFKAKMYLNEINFVDPKFHYIIIWYTQNTKDENLPHKLL